MSTKGKQWKWSEKSKNKLSLARTGKKYPKLGIALKEKWAREGHPCLGRIISQETRNKISKGNKGKKHSEEAKRRIGLASRGNKYSLGYCHTKKSRLKMSLGQIKRVKEGKNFLWKGGIAKKNKTRRNLIMLTVKYRWWRDRVFKRDNHQCVIGGKEHGNKLEADHIKPFALFPKERFKISNGRTLCQSCHRKTETYAGKFNH